MKAPQARLGLIVQQLATIEWRWTQEWWVDLVRRLGLTITERAETRISFRWFDDIDLDLYFVNEEPQRLELIIDVCSIPEEDILSATDRLTEEYETKFDECLVQIKGVLGNAQFRGGFGDDGYPEYELADTVAIWSIKGAALGLRMSSGHDEMPFILDLVVAGPVVAWDKS